MVTGWSWVELIVDDQLTGTCQGEFLWSRHIQTMNILESVEGIIKKGNSIMFWLKKPWFSGHFPLNRSFENRCQICPQGIPNSWNSEAMSRTAQICPAGTKAPEIVLCLTHSQPIWCYKPIILCLKQGILKKKIWVETQLLVWSDWMWMGFQTPLHQTHTEPSPKDHWASENHRVLYPKFDGKFGSSPNGSHQSSH